MRKTLALIVALMPIILPASLLAAGANYGTKMTSKVSTTHYSMITNIGDARTRDAGRKLELLRMNLIKTFGAGKSPASVKLLARKVDVVIFQHKAQFVKYSAITGVKVPRNACGYFRVLPRDKRRYEIVTYANKQMTSTLLHEGTHQLLQVTLAPGTPPQWLTEGMAVYFEQSSFVGRKMKAGGIHKHYRAVLRKALNNGTNIPISNLIRRDKSRMLSATGYAQSWSLVYYLVHYRKGAYHKKFRNYIKALRAKKDPVKAFEKHFTKNVDKLERSWKKYVLKM